MSSILFPSQCLGSRSKWFSIVRYNLSMVSLIISYSSCLLRCHHHRWLCSPSPPSVLFTVIAASSLTSLPASLSVNSMSVYPNYPNNYLKLPLFHKSVSSNQFDASCDGQMRKYMLCRPQNKILNSTIIFYRPMPYSHTHAYSTSYPKREEVVRQQSVGAALTIGRT